MKFVHVQKRSSCTRQVDFRSDDSWSLIAEPFNDVPSLSVRRYSRYAVFRAAKQICSSRNDRIDGGWGRGRWVKLRTISSYHPQNEPSVPRNLKTFLYRDDSGRNVFVLKALLHFETVFDYYVPKWAHGSSISRKCLKAKPFYAEADELKKIPPTTSIRR